MSDTIQFDTGEPEDPPPGEISFVMLANVILGNRRLIVGLSFVFFVVTAVFTVLKPVTYTSSVSFVPQAAESSAGGLAGLASQFGFNIPMGKPGQSPEFYVGLIHSRQLLTAVAESDFRVSSADEPQTRDLSEWYGVRTDDEARRRLATVQELRDRIATRIGREGIVGISVRDGEPELAAAITARMLQLLNEFNLHTRQSEAAAEREFIEDRLDAVGEDLVEAEDRLETFLRSNRQYERSPELSFEYGRLNRDVSLKQQVATTLAQAYEQARIDEVRNTPVITVIDQPEVPVIPDRRFLIFRSLVAIVLGAAIGILFAFAREYARKDRLRDGDAFARFDELRREALDDVRGLRGRLPGVGKGSSTGE